jgi:hypothetical protein
VTTATDLPDARPDYGGAWNGGILPALLGGDGPPRWFPGPLREARTVVLLVLDGLGWSMVRDHAEVVPTLAAMEGRAITTAAPTTTVAGLPSIVTGLTPSQHGMVGFRMRVGGEVLSVLRWKTASGDPGPDPRTVQPHTGFCGVPVPVVTRRSFEGSGFTLAHLRDGRMVGWETIEELVAAVAAEVDGGERVVYAYHDGVDKVAHEHGLRDHHLVDELRVTDALVRDLLAALPPTCTVAVTADHGHVHIGADGMRDLRAVRQLTAAYSGEGRFRSLHAGPGAAKRLLGLAREAYGEEAWVLSRDEVWASGLLGPEPGPGVRGRIGDVVLIAREDVAYVAPDLAREGELVGCHGSLTPDELEVPLLAARGEG